MSSSLNLYHTCCELYVSGFFNSPMFLQYLGVICIIILGCLR